MLSLQMCFEILNTAIENTVVGIQSSPLDTALVKLQTSASHDLKRLKCDTYIVCTIV